MPVVRNISSRRSKRLSTQELISNDEDGWESCPGELLYPDSEPETIASPAPQSRSASLIVPPPPPPSRPSHARQRPEDHIPRPPNPFIVFRSDYCVWNRQLDSGAVRDHRLVSKLAGQAWAALDSASRKKYEDLAREKKRLHAIQYPDYAYAPSSRSGGKGKKRKANDDRDYEERMPQSKRRKSRGGAQPLNVTACVESVNPHSPTNCGRKQSSLTLTAAPSLDFSRSQTPELSPNSSSESPDPEPVLRTPTATSLDLVYDDDDFVPTADIPPLYLDADAPSEV
ncbi:hypothetical protein DFH09DRAFT_1067907 [Mycena vulgaris]|nr:hypothetical protein DFH09DRAFT_1067907 [Mycena vulgaris]